MPKHLAVVSAHREKEPGGCDLNYMERTTRERKTVVKLERLGLSSHVPQRIR